MAQSSFCPNCGTPVPPGVKFCPTCGQAFTVVPQEPQAPQAPQYEPQQPAQPQYQQPQYQQPQYQQAPPAPPIKNLWAIITGSSVGFFCLLTLIFGIICMTSVRGFMNLHSLMGIFLFFCGAGITVFFIAQRPFSANLPQKDKTFSLVFEICNVVAWLFVMIAFIAIRAADIMFIFAMLFFCGAGVFGFLTFKNDLVQLNKLTWGLLATLLTIALWFLLSIFAFAGGAGADLLGYMMIVTAMSLGAAAAVFLLHYLKAPDTKLF